MPKRIKQIGAGVAILAIVFFATWPLWQALYIRSASAALRERTLQLVEKNPELKAAWEKALADKVLTRDEAKEIVESAGEKVADDE